jgi:hypothetical protein
MVTMSQGERGILEFKYKSPGQYMFHAHKTEFAEKGWMGLFLVKDMTSSGGGPEYNSTTANNMTATVVSQSDQYLKKRGGNLTYEK